MRRTSWTWRGGWAHETPCVNRRLTGNYADDGIVLELPMPGIGRIQVLEGIRTASPNATTPVIIVSVLSGPDTKNRCIAGGANAYVVKPVERKSLAATLKAQTGAGNKPKSTRT